MGFHSLKQQFYRLPQIVRYGITGGSGVAFGYALYALLVLAGLDPVWALAVSNAAAAVAAYFFHRHGAFQDSRNSRLSLYLLTAFMFYVINATALKLLLISGVSPLWAQLGLLPVMVALSFVSAKYVVFKDRA